MTSCTSIHINIAVIGVNILHIFGYLAKSRPNCSYRRWKHFLLLRPWYNTGSSSETCSLLASTNFGSIMVVQISVMHKNDWVIFEEYSQKLPNCFTIKNSVLHSIRQTDYWKYCYYLMHSNSNMDPEGTSSSVKDTKPHPELEFS
jgi:hypothetical protein